MRSFVLVSRHAAMCLLLALGATAVAQDRRPCLGQVVDATGAPVQGAAVVAVWASPVDPSFLHDEQRAVTDARGRFRLPLWNAVPYAVWAIGPAVDGARAQVSGVVHGACGGGLLDPLPLAAPDGDSLRLEGLDAWRAHGAAALTLHCGAMHFDGLPLLMPAEGEPSVALPSRPTLCCALVVRDEGTSWWFQPPFGVATWAQLANGRHLDAAWSCFELWRRVDQGVVGPPWQSLGALVPGSAAPTARQLSGHGVRTTLRVLDEDGGPGRRAFVCVAPFGASTGADERHWLHADQGGRVELGLSPGSYGVFACDGRSFGEAKVEIVGGDAAGERAVTVTLAPLPTLRCRVLDAAGAPSPGARLHSMMHVPWPVLPDAELRLRLSVRQMLRYRVVVQTVTDADGRIELPVLGGQPEDTGGPQFAFQRADGSMTGQVELVSREGVVDVK